MKTNIILQGDALEKLKKLTDESVNCVMTSPPYWALRDYGVEGQLGLEPTFDLYIKHLCDIFNEVKRVLRKDGTCWVNLGDTYIGSPARNKTDESEGEDGVYSRLRSRNMSKDPKNPQSIRAREQVPKQKLPNKSLTMIPQRFAIEMVNRGWILRNIIIWHKPNPIPHSVKDRFTVDFEYLFFFVKSKKYWFKQQREKRKYDYDKEIKYDGKNPSCTSKKITKEDRDKIRNRGIEKGFKYDKVYNHPDGRNKRTVWKITTRSLKEAHFAVYPEELCETPIKAGCPEGGVVLDPFFGSGTTGLVALKQNKKFIGIELNPEYIKIAKKRLKPYLEQRKLK